MRCYTLTEATRFRVGKKAAEPGSRHVPQHRTRGIQIPLSRSPFGKARLSSRSGSTRQHWNVWPNSGVNGRRGSPWIDGQVD